MSIQANFPAIKPTLLLDFANTEALDPRITFTRASTATYYGTRTAKAEENLLTFSQEFDQWVSSGAGANVTANSTTAPDSTATADTLDNTAGATLYRYLIPATVIGLQYVWSIFVKNSTATTSTFQVRTSSTAVFATITWTGATITGSTLCTYTDVGNGWYRVVVPYTAGETAARHRVYPGDASTTSGVVFLWGAQLEQRDAVTAYTPTTTQPITNYIPVLETAASGVARFDHNPTTFESLGLLIEEQRTNLLLRSEEFDNASWSKSQATVTANTIIAPDGTLTGDKLIANSGTGVGSGQIFQEFSASAGVAYTMSVYLKPAGQTLANVVVNARSSVPAAITFMFISVDLSNGTIVNSGNGTFTNVSSTITLVGNGYYRVTLTGTPPATTATLRFNVTNSAVGDGFNGVFAWGAQAEAGAFPTSYIPTVASQVTRAADAASMTGANFSSWYNAEQGSLYAEGLVLGQPVGTNYHFASIADATGANSLSLRVNNNTLRFLGLSFVNNGSSASLTNSTNLVAGQNSKVAFGYKVNDFAISANADTPVTSSSGLVPQGLNILRIGLGPSATQPINRTIKKIAYYPVRVTNAQLQALTS